MFDFLSCCSGVQAGNLRCVSLLSQPLCSEPYNGCYCCKSPLGNRMISGNLTVQTLKRITDGCWRKQPGSTSPELQQLPGHLKSKKILALPSFTVSLKFYSSGSPLGHFPTMHPFNTLVVTSCKSFRGLLETKPPPVKG